MGDCVAGIFLPPMWREETEHTTHYGTTIYTTGSLQVPAGQYMTEY